MSYTIRPQEVFGVIAATAREQAELQTQLTGASGQLETAGGGAPGAPAVVAALGSLRADHDRLTALEQTRVDRASHGCLEAVAAYRAGDQQMAEAFTQSAAVLLGSPIGAYPPTTEPFPDILTGG